MAENRKPPVKVVDKVRAAEILADANALGSDKKAAEKWGCTERTIRNYRRRMQEGDEEISSKFRKLESEAAAGWAMQRVLALNAAMKRACELLPFETSLKEIGSFVESVGGVDVAKQVLGEGGSARPEDSGLAEDAGQPVEGTDERGVLPH
jgi:hypothetical protein